MVHTTATNFRKNLFGLLDQAIRFNEPVNVSTKNGNAVVISEDEYNDLVESLYVSSHPVMREKIIEGLNTPLSECVCDDEAPW